MIFSYRTPQILATIDENRPPREGLALLGEILWREGWNLIKLNLLLVIVCLPIITLPAGFVAAFAVCITMCRDEDRYMGKVFWGTFKTAFVPATIIGLGAALLLAIAGYVVYFYIQMATLSLAFAVPVALSAAVFVFVLTMTAYAFVLMGAGQRQVTKLVVQAFKTTLLKPWHVCAASFTGVVWVAIFMALLPLSQFIAPFFLFSPVILTLAFSAVGALDHLPKKASG